jgi:hypothetical protein
VFDAQLEWERLGGTEPRPSHPANTNDISQNMEKMDLDEGGNGEGVGSSDDDGDELIASPTSSSLQDSTKTRT